MPLIPDGFCGRPPGTPEAEGVVGAGSPAVLGDQVVFPYSSGEVSAIAADGGAQVWKAAVAGKRLGRAYASYGDLTGDPVVSGGVIYIGSAAGRTVAMDAKTGMRLWTANEGAINPPLVVGGSVFVVNDEARLVRLDASTGEVIWAQAMPYFVKDKAEKAKGDHRALWPGSGGRADCRCLG